MDEKHFVGKKEQSQLPSYILCGQRAGSAIELASHLMQIVRDSYKPAKAIYSVPSLVSQEVLHLQPGALELKDVNPTTLVLTRPVSTISVSNAGITLVHPFLPFRDHNDHASLKLHHVSHIHTLTRRHHF
jgi:hypothetical protein